MRSELIDLLPSIAPFMKSCSETKPVSSSGASSCKTNASRKSVIIIASRWACKFDQIRPN
jgi:hypothetical protein